MRCVAVINQKGGVGKTTTTVNHGAALARLGHRVLLLDMDPQANLTLHVDSRPEGDAKTLTDLLIDGASFAEMIKPTSTPDLFVVPSDTSLAGVEQVLAGRIGREMILKEALGTIEDRGFDFVLIDCPPSLGVLSANALVAAQEVLIPIQTEYFALQGMAKLVEIIELVQRSLNPGLHIKAVLPCMVDHRTRLSSEVQEEIRRHFGKLLAQTVIRMNVKLAEAPSFGLTIFQHAPESNGAQDHDHFAREFLGWEIPVEEEEEEYEDEEEEELDEADQEEGLDEDDEEEDGDTEEVELEDVDATESQEVMSPVAPPPPIPEATAVSVNTAAPVAAAAPSVEDDQGASAAPAASPHPTPDAEEAPTQPESTQEAAAEEVAEDAPTQPESAQEAAGQEIAEDAPIEDQAAESAPTASPEEPTTPPRPAATPGPSAGSSAASVEPPRPMEAGGEE